jgi:serine/threonine-protein kinase
LPFAGLDWPSGVAVDGSRTVYVTDSNNNRVLRLAAGSNTADTLPFTGRFALVHPRGVAADARNAVYVADHDNHRVLKLAAGSNTAEELPFIGLNFPAGVAVDSSGNVYVSDEGSIRVYELQNLGGLYHPTDVSFPGLGDPPSGPHGVAVDSDGHVYVTDASNRVLKLAAGATTVLPLTGLNSPGGVAVDSGGAVYVADWGHGRVLKLPRG